jgi:hypothetical protein
MLRPYHLVGQFGPSGSMARRFFRRLRNQAIVIAAAAVGWYHCGKDDRTLGGNT